MNKAPNRPFADIVRPGKPWTAVTATPDGSYVDLKQRIISAPPGSDHLSSIVRSHELAHARFSQIYAPKFRKTVAASEPAWQMAEDYLITRELERRDLPVPCYCADCTTEANRIVDAIADILKANKHPDPIPCAQAVAAVKMGRSYWPDNDLADGALNTAYMLTHATRGMSRGQWQARRKAIAEYLETFLSVPESGGAGKAPSDLEDSPQGEAIKWRQMDIKTPPLCQSRVAPYTRKRRATDTGSVIRLIHRATIDGCVFTRTQRATGASVLIDGSGSMSLDDEELDALINRFPAGIVAIYSGGELTILADKGRRVADLPELDGSNECDGPALDWLIRQDGPRYWITDLGVTEEGDSFTLRALNYCVHTAARGQVRILPKVQALLKH